MTKGKQQLKTSPQNGKNDLGTGSNGKNTNGTTKTQKNPQQSNQIGKNPPTNGANGKSGKDGTTNGSNGKNSQVGKNALTNVKSGKNAPINGSNGKNSHGAQTKVDPKILNKVVKKALFTAQVWHFAILWVVMGTLVSVAIHTSVHGFNTIQASLAFFLSVNVLVCLWEIVLSIRIDYIYSLYSKYAKSHKDNEYRLALDFFQVPLTFSNILSPELWSEVWATYSVFDPSYASKESFGFFIDVGNGYTTIIPSFIYLYNMTYPLLTAKWLGVMGIICFYQEWYGTIIYWLSFAYNKRHSALTWDKLILFVGFTNGIWFTFTLLGVYASIQLVMDGNFDIFR